MDQASQAGRTTQLWILSCHLLTVEMRILMTNDSHGTIVMTAYSKLSVYGSCSMAVIFIIIPILQIRQ